MSDKLTNEEIQKAREVNLLQLLGYDPSRQRNICCPSVDHRDSIPSCTVYPDNSFYCHGCGLEGQNAIDFVMSMDEKFNEVVLELIK